MTILADVMPCLAAAAIGAAAAALLVLVKVLMSFLRLNWYKDRITAWYVTKGDKPLSYSITSVYGVFRFIGTPALVSPVFRADGPDGRKSAIKFVLFDTSNGGVLVLMVYSEKPRDKHYPAMLNYVWRNQSLETVIKGENSEFTAAMYKWMGGIENIVKAVTDLRQGLQK